MIFVYQSLTGGADMSAPSSVNSWPRKFVLTVGMSLVTAFVDLRGKYKRSQTGTDENSLATEMTPTQKSDIGAYC